LPVMGVIFSVHNSLPKHIFSKKFGVNRYNILIGKILQPNKFFRIIRCILTQTKPSKRNCHGNEPSPIPTRIVLMNVHEITCTSYSLSLREREFKLLKLFRAHYLPTFQSQFGTDGQWAVARKASRWPKGFRCCFFSSLLPTLRVTEKLKQLQASP